MAHHRSLVAIAATFSVLWRIDAVSGGLLPSSSAITSAPLLASPPSPTAGLVFEAHGIAFSSALDIEASVRHELAQVSSVPALPIPTSDGYEAVAKLATGPLPPVQVTSGELNVNKTVQDILAEADRRITTNTNLIQRQSTPRIMIVGDSISHGQQGDTTWRYRLWQWLHSQNVGFQFVGPYTGTFQSTCALATGPQSPPQPPPLYDGSSTPPSTSSPTNNLNGGYAQSVDSAFTSNNNDAHFAVWGRALAVDKGLIQSMLQSNPADMILLELGFNDMGFFYSDCYGTINSLQTFINNARAANPNIKFAVANVPQRTYIRNDLTTNISTYNQILPGYLQQWSTPQSPIQLVDFEGNYDCGTTNCPAGYDGLHPNSWGEYQIAQAFSKALIAGYGIGSTPVTIPAQSDPSVMRSIGVPTNFQVFTSPQGVSATWDAVYGAYSYNVDVHVNGGGGIFSPGTSQINRWDCQWSLPGWQYSVRVQAACGDQTGPWTTAQTATSQPQLAPPPENIVVTPTGDGFTVTWDPPTGDNTDNIIEYNIIYWDTTPSDCNFITGAAFKNSPAQINDLEVGKSYLVAPVTWNSNGQGLPFIANNVIPGSQTPPVPSNLQAVSNDGTSVHLSWTGSNSAAGYEVFYRNATGGDYMSLGNTSVTCLDDYYLYPGTFTYEFCVAAYNGNDESAQGSGVIPPSPSGSAAAQTCAPAPSWCPGYGTPYSGGYVGGCAGCGSNGCPSGSSNCAASSTGGGSGSGSVTVISPTTETTTNAAGKTITTVLSGTTQTLGPTTSPPGPGGSSSGSFTVVGGTTETTTNANGMTYTTVVGGTTESLTVVGGTTETTTNANGQTITTVVGGTTEAVPPTSSPPGPGGPSSSDLTVLGGTTETTTNSNGMTITTVVGGTTESISVVGGTTETTTNSNGMTITTVVGGSTSTIPLSPSSSSSSTGSGIFPVIMGGQGECTGPGCINGQCTSDECVVFGCTGSGCVNGQCQRSSGCTPDGCAGSNCVNGQCKGSGCVTRGCTGSDCDSNGDGRCHGPNCVGIGCAGPDCPGGDDSNGICIGINCSIEVCSGLDCLEGSCIGPTCNVEGTNQGGGDNAPDDDPDDDCGNNGDGVTSAPSCVVTCMSASATQTCTTNCQTTTGCSVSATTSTTTIASDAFIIPDGIYDYFDSRAINDPAVSSAADAAFSSEDGVVTAPDPTTTSASPSPTSSSPSPPPTPPPQPPYSTLVDSGPRGVYCYSTNPSGYSSFELASASSAVTALCNAGYVLEPSQTTSLIGTYGSNPTVLAAIGWAPDQTGCDPKHELPINGTDCPYYYNFITNGCGSGEVYEGGYIAQASGYGCIELTIGAPADAQH